MCRDDKIRTCGLFVPNEARYRAALHPEPDFFGLQKYNFFYYPKQIFKSLFVFFKEYTKISLEVFPF